MTVDEIKLFVEYISNKEQSGNSLSSDEFNRLLNTSSLDFARFIYGTPEGYKPGDPTPNMAYEVTQYVTDALRVLKVINKTLTVSNTGEAVIPADYAHHSSLRYTYMQPGKCATDPPTPKMVKIEVVKDDKLGVLLQSSIKIPTQRYPICVFYNTYMQFYPIDLKSVVFTYLKTPPAPFRAYTVSGDIDIYDAGNSTQVAYPEIFHMEICRIILNYMGVNLRDNELQSYNERYKQRGQ